MPGRRKGPRPGRWRLGVQGDASARRHGDRELEDLSVDEVIEQFDVTREQVTAVLEFVAQSLRAIDVPPVLVLFDHGTRKGLARALSGHSVHTAQSRGWDTLGNGALLDAAEDAGFELLLTTDRRIRYKITRTRISL